MWKRPIGKRGSPKPAFLIVCEGTKTEPKYFRKFPIRSVHVRVFGLAKDPSSLIRDTLLLRRDELRYGYRYEQVWCVFDRDRWPAQNFNNAINLAKKEKIYIAYSNEAFELWYLLHFIYFDTAISRKDYIKKLKNKSGFNGKYKKNDPTNYDRLVNRQSIAIRNAKKLLSRYKPLNPNRDNPSTTVHCLVEELRKLMIK